MRSQNHHNINMRALSLAALATSALALRAPVAPSIRCRTQSAQRAQRVQRVQKAWRWASVSVAAAPSSEEQSEQTSEQWSSLTVNELKAELKGRGLATSGLKRDLIDRLAGLPTDAVVPSEKGISSNHHRHRHHHHHHHHRRHHQHHRHRHRRLRQPFSAFTKSSSDAPSPSPSSSSKRRAPKAVPWVTCASTTEMNRACEMLIKEGDHVLELGAQLQATSENIAKAAGPTGAVFQLDVARKVPRQTHSMPCHAMPC